MKAGGYIRYENLPLENRLGERREVEFVSNLYREDGHTVILCNIRDNNGRKAAGREAEAVRERVPARAVTQADHDPLPGLFNHRAFSSGWRRQCAPHARPRLYPSWFSDLDSFKFFSDVYGHGGG